MWKLEYNEKIIDSALPVERLFMFADKYNGILLFQAKSGASILGHNPVVTITDNSQKITESLAIINSIVASPPLHTPRCCSAISFMTIKHSWRSQVFINRQHRIYSRRYRAACSRTTAIFISTPGAALRCYPTLQRSTKRRSVKSHTYTQPLTWRKLG